MIAAILDERDVLRGRADELPADLALRVRIVCGHDHHERADRRDVARVRDRATDIARRGNIRIDFDEIVAEHAGAALALAFPDRVAVRRRQPGQFQMRTGSGAWVAATDATGQRAVHRRRRSRRQPQQRTRAHRRRDRARRPDRLARGRGRAASRSSTWDKQRDDLVVHETVRLGSMTARRAVPPGAPRRDATVDALIERVRATRLSVLNWTDGAQQLRRRLAFAASHLGWRLAGGR